MRYKRLLFGLMASVFVPMASFAQDSAGIEGGLSLGATIGQTESKDEPHVIGRAFLQYPIASFLRGDLGMGFGRTSGKDYHAIVFPFDHRFVIGPTSKKTLSPFVYVGIGAFQYDVGTRHPPQSTKANGWTGVIPLGAGVKYRISSQRAIQFNAGYNYLMTDELNGLKAGRKDAYWEIMLGLVSVGGGTASAPPDDDRDGLSNEQEKQFKTNPKVADTDGDGLLDGVEVNQYSSDALVPDTDGDGLTDGAEVNTHKTSPTKPDTDGDGLADGTEVNTHRTDPLKMDTDGDGLADGAEVNSHRTDPLKPDTDGDGLADGAEVNSHRTDPLKMDTDGDGLADGTEVNTHRTDPLKVDTDGDGLADGAEVNTHRTDPLKVDTDGGSIADGVEVSRGSNPLQAKDDRRLEVEVGRALTLEGIVFETGSAVISPASEQILEEAYNTLSQMSDIVVEIRGYTDNVGSRSSNMTLSQNRAEAVRANLVAKGIAASRITAKGFGPDSPVAPNDTPDNRLKNRRIEFFRTK